MRKRWVLVCGMLLLCVFLFAGCGGSAPLPRPMPSAAAEGEEAKPMVTVEGSCEAVLSGDSLTVRGENNLMDGTNGVITVLSSTGLKVDEVKITKQGNNLEHTFTVDEEWPDEVYGFISFGTNQGDKQPREVTEAYGKKFEYLDGDSSIIIWDNKGIVAVFQSEMVTIR